MFSNKENVNILTELLRQHGVSMAVVCPGSRNAPIVHNLNACGMECVPVTDERSAGFYALGMSLASGEPVAVCVTSGTALLNLAPAVAEAFYRHVPLIVISADRPEAWIGQLDGQTLPQPGAFGGFVRKCVTLPEPIDRVQRWHCSRLVNEALTTARRGVPVHINVPLSEPLFDFSVTELPDVRSVKALRNDETSSFAIKETARRVLTARRPMIVVGQTDYSPELASALNSLSRHAVVLHEPLGADGGAVHFDEVLHRIGDNPDYRPDFILYAGDTIVSKRLKKFLRGTPGADTWAISPDGEIHDTFMNQTAVIEGHACAAMCALAALSDSPEASAAIGNRPESAGDFIGRWQKALDEAYRRAADYKPRYSQTMAVKLFEEMLEELDYDFFVHYANSSAVRLANIYAHHYIYVNRGVNGIEGSLSTAAGFSLVREEMTFCVIGDLSFFYDCNALWNRSLKGNLRILLLNNCGGGIFHQLHGLEASPVRDSYIAATHRACAHGICDTHDIGYLSARNAEELSRNMKTFLYSGTQRPLLFEVFTDTEEDTKAVAELYRA